MKIRINKIIDHTHENERVEFAVIEKTNLQYWIVADTTFIDPNHISNKLRHIHWFLSKDVVAGDQVILYTRKGSDRSEKINTVNTRYHIYWQLNSSVWNDTGDAAILINTNSWQTTKTK